MSNNNNNNNSTKEGYLAVMSRTAHNNNNTKEVAMYNISNTMNPKELALALNGTPIFSCRAGLEGACELQLTRAKIVKLHKEGMCEVAIPQNERAMFTRYADAVCTLESALFEGFAVVLTPKGQAAASMELQVNAAMKATASNRAAMYAAEEGLCERVEAVIKATAPHRAAMYAAEEGLCEQIEAAMKATASDRATMYAAEEGASERPSQRVARYAIEKEGAVAEANALLVAIVNAAPLVEARNKAAATSKYAATELAVAFIMQNGGYIFSDGDLFYTVINNVVGWLCTPCDGAKLPLLARKWYAQQCVKEGYCEQLTANALGIVVTHK